MEQHEQEARCGAIGAYRRWDRAGSQARWHLTALILLLLLGSLGSSQGYAADPIPVYLPPGGGVANVAIPVNKSETIRLDHPYAEVRVGATETAAGPAIAEVVPLNDRSIYVLGRRIGTTNISLFDSRAELIGVIEVEVTLDVGLVQAKIRETTGNPNITVRDSGGQLILSGAVGDAPTVDRAVQIASQFAPGAVVNAMQVTSTQQVLLKVRFIEANRSAGRELGIRWDGRGSRSNIRVGREARPTFTTAEGDELVAHPPGRAPLLQGLAQLISGGTPFGVVLATLLNDGFNIDVLIQALEEKGLGRRLAEPNLVALSGDTAEFLAGGEFPVPVPTDDGNVAIEYKDFGVGLAFTPTVLKDGHINLKIEPSVSELDFSTGVSVAGVTVPALTTRRASTTIELRDGQSFAIAGLLQTESRRQIAQLPWISRIPIIGALFRSTSFTSR
ncbi:MAG TPA: type II and III secretion system protein family protein, partial [Thermomicrobiales bacterium]|nr:type II and III secretion system protein family protein [Thermomicrobiales bacterium]